MAKCVCIQHVLKTIETGGLDSYVTIFDRQIVPPAGENTNFGMQFVNPYSAWGYFQSVKGIEILDDSNIDTQTTELFFMRYNPDVPITSEKWLGYKGRYFRILNVTNINRDERYLILELRERGKDEDEDNFA